MQELYTIEDVMKLTGYKRTKSADIIVKLKEQIIIDYPGTMTVGARIPKWYFNEKILGIKEEGGKNEKTT